MAKIKVVQDCLREPTAEKLGRTELSKGRRERLSQHLEDDDGHYDFLAPPQRPDELGRLGSYRALEVLGAGGMGVVFRAEDVSLRRQAALKVMLPGVAASPSGKARFLREARTAAAIKHDHVVTIYQVDEDNGVPFIAMELVQGQSLEKRLAHDKKLTAEEILHIGRQIAAGLAAGPRPGACAPHIKPANIWLESRTAQADDNPADEAASACNTRVKILDFGLACDTREDSHLTRLGESNLIRQLSGEISVRYSWH